VSPTTQRDVANFVLTAFCVGPDVVVLDRPCSRAAVALFINERAATAVALPNLAPNGGWDRTCTWRFPLVVAWAGFAATPAMCATWSLGDYGLLLQGLSEQQIQSLAHNDGRICTGKLVAAKVFEHA